MSMEMDYSAAGAMASMEQIEQWVEQTHDDTTIRAWRRLRQYVECLAQDHHQLQGHQRDLKRALQQTLVQLGRMPPGPEVTRVRETLNGLNAY